MTALVLSDASVDEPDPAAQRAGSRVAADRRRDAGLRDAAWDPAWSESRDRPSAQRCFAAALEDGQEERLERVTCPVLVATGDLDPNLESSRRMVRAPIGAAR